jgi:hypothetical protein
MELHKQAGMRFLRDYNHTGVQWSRKEAKASRKALQ